MSHNVDLNLEAQKAIVRLLNSEADAAEALLRESLNLDTSGLGFLTPQDLGIGDDPRFLPVGGPAGQQFLNRQRRGEFIPAFLNEPQLALYRRRIRALVVGSEVALNAINQRVNYGLGTGLRYEVTPRREDCPAWVVEAAQAVVDAFCEYNELHQREAELLSRVDVDGEAILRLFPQRQGLLAVRFVEPEFMRSPDGDSSRDSFGVRNIPGDVESVEGYWIIEEDGAQPTFVPVDDVLHVKHPETPSTSKRGLSAFYPIESTLRAAESLVSSTVSIAKARAKLAWIRKLSGATSAVAQSLIQRQTSVTGTDPVTGETMNMERLRDGTIMTIPDTQSIEMPSANINSADHVTVLQMVLRLVAARFSMPEYLLTADASNGNFACHDSETDLLTRRGWLRYDQIRQDDLAATMNPETGRFEWQPIQVVHVHDYTGDLVHLQGRDINVAVTHNHRMYVTRHQNRRQDGKMVREGLKPYHFVRADEIRAGDILPLSTEPSLGEEHLSFTIPPVPHDRYYTDPASHPQPVSVPMGPFLRFLGWWISEGWVCRSPAYQVALSQAGFHTEECEDIRKTFTALPYNSNEYVSKDGCHSWVIHDKSLFAWLKEHCGEDSYTRRIPDFVFDLPASQQSILLDALLLGDGSHRASGSAVYCTVSRDLANQVQMLALSCGYICNESKPQKQSHTEQPRFIISVRLPGRAIHIQKNHIHSLPYSGKVWCVTVDNGLIVTRRGGKVVVAGNSTLVAESPFVKGMERLQDFLSRVLGRNRYHGPRQSLIWRQLHHAAQEGLLPGDISRWVDVQVEGPTLTVRDPQKDSHVNQTYHSMGVKSRKTIQLEQGLDPDVEARNFADEAQEQPSGQGADSPSPMEDFPGQVSEDTRDAS